MAFVVADRVKETTTTTGTGTVTLAGAATGFQSFSAIGDGNNTYYAIVGETEWEVGVGTYTASGTTLSRDTVLASSNSGSLVNFSAGSKDVFVTYPAGKSAFLKTDSTLNVYTTAVGWENPTTISQDYTITSGNNMMTAGPVTINTGYTVTVPSGSVWTIV